MELERVITAFSLCILAMIYILRKTKKCNNVINCIFDCLEFVCIILSACMLGRAKW